MDRTNISKNKRQDAMTLVKLFNSIQINKPFREAMIRQPPPPPPPSPASSNKPFNWN